jgi:hypothetical protein
LPVTEEFPGRPDREREQLVEALLETLSWQ